MVSGRITPTLPAALATLAGAEVSGAFDEDFGGSVSLQIALAFLALPPELLLDELELELELPELQAARANTVAAPSAATEIVDLRIVAPFVERGPRGHAA